MPLNADFWFDLTPRLRFACWLTGACCGLMLAWWLAVFPLKDRQVQLLIQQETHESALRAQWRKVRDITPPQQSATEVASSPFTPLDFHTHEQQLVRWQPAQNGGEMVLQTQWSRVTGTFLMLAQRDMRVPSFSLVTEGNGLRFTLGLEHDHDR